MYVLNIDDDASQHTATHMGTYQEACLNLKPSNSTLLTRNLELTLAFSKLKSCAFCQHPLQSLY